MRQGERCCSGGSNSRAEVGRVAPTAGSLGVSFSDLLASVAAITGQGLNTAEAVTGMKAALANIIKPTSDAGKEASRLGIKFDAATLRARGLTGFLEATPVQFTAKLTLEEIRDVRLVSEDVLASGTQRSGVGRGGA